MDDVRKNLDDVALCLQENRFHDALKLCLDVLAASPNQPDALYLLGVIAFRLQQPAQALQWLDRTLAESPYMAVAWLLRARVLRMLQRPDEAITSADMATRHGALVADAWHCAGFMKMAMGRWAEARADLAEAVRLDPHNAVVRSQYALTLNENDEVFDAFDQVQEALKQLPGHPEIMMAKADILESAGYYDLARKYRPVDRIVTFNQAASVFLTGDYPRGLGLITARLEAQHPLFTSLLRWDGAEDFGLHLLLAGEQGYGDMIQFLRYVPLLKDFVGKISLRVPHLLVRLVRESMPYVSLVPFADPAKKKEDPAVPVAGNAEVPSDVGACCRLMSLPKYVVPAFDFMGGAVPYLRASSDLRAVWRKRLDAVRGPRIGLVWAGNRRHTNDHKRSVPWRVLEPLINQFKAQLVSMQVGGAETVSFFDATPFIEDFADSAALLSELDLLISVDSAPAHLAGALGRPVWTLLPFNSDWRWLLGGEDTAWYPSMRLFRQKAPGDWSGVVADVVAELTKFLAGDRSVLKPQSGDGYAFNRHPRALALPDVELD